MTISTILQEFKYLSTNFKLLDMKYKEGGYVFFKYFSELKKNILALKPSLNSREGKYLEINAE